MFPNHLKFAGIFVVGLGMSLFTTVALTNIMVLLLLLTALWAWRSFRLDMGKDVEVFKFLVLIVMICLWDIATNMCADQGWGASFKAVVHDMRTFGFIVLLWPLFSNQKFSSIAMWGLFGSVATLAVVNLLLVLIGHFQLGMYLPIEMPEMHGKNAVYFWSTAPHLYGQALVGLVFVLAQMQLVRPRISWPIVLLLCMLLASLFIASERRTGYVLLLAGFVVWAALNYRRFFVGKYKWWIALTGVAVFFAAMLSPMVQARMAVALAEINQYLDQSTIERANNATSIGIRMQFYVSAWTVVMQNFWIGVGSIEFPVLFQATNAGMGGVTNLSVFTNPHNEYIYILATKGVVGLILYLAIFAQACRMALRKADEVQRIGLLVFVFLFMLSITTNSMMIDMEEGHFTMLILLIFLAPKSLGLDRSHADGVKS